MPTIRSRASASLLVLAGIAGPAGAQSRSRATTSSPPPPANVAAGGWMSAAPQTFSVVLQVERSTSQFNNGNGASVTAQVAAAVCKSTAIADPALVAAFGLPADQARPLAVIDAQPTSDSFLTLTVTLNDPQKKLAADAGSKLLNELATRATKALSKSGELQAEPLRDRRVELAKRVDDAQSQSDALDAQYAKFGSLVDPNGNYVRGNVMNLQPQRNQLATQLAGLKARLTAIEQLTPPATTQPTPSNGATSRPSDASLDLLARREAAAAKARAGGDEAAIADAEARLDEARVLTTLLDTIRANAPAARPYPINYYPGANTGGFGAMDAGALRVQIADVEAQLASIDAQLAATPGGSSSTQPTMSANDVNQLMNDRNEARQRVRQARQELEQFDRQYGSIRAPRILPLTGAD